MTNSLSEAVTEAATEVAAEASETPSEPQQITDNLDQLLAVLPPDIRAAILPDERGQLMEIILDLGRLPEARFRRDYRYLRDTPITHDELKSVETKLGAFGDDNRAGIAATLHRISAIRNRRGGIVGLTLRVGRAVSGIVDILRDLIASGQSVLLMGRPGLGKTTMLREIARVLADEENRRVVIVDTSNEIAGDGDVPHPAIGRARRMQVARVAQQHDVMIEAVENHMPQTVVIDEIGRLEEAMAARTIAERGVQLIATVHGNTLDNLLNNPSMSDLIGGIGAVTLSDEEARRRGTQKTVLERKAPPTFDVVVEMIERSRIAVRRPVDETVDSLLRGMPLAPEIRWRDENGEIHIETPAPQEIAERQEHSFDMRPRDQRDNRQSDNRGARSERGARARNQREQSPRERQMRERSDDASDEASRRYANGGNGAASTCESENGVMVAARDDEVQPRWNEARLDAARVRRLYPFGVSRSRLTRAIKQLGLPLTLSRSWNEADAVLLLSGGGVTADSSLLREARELGLPIVGVRGNTYAQILGRLNDLFGELNSQGESEKSASSPRELALDEARNAAQRVLKEAEPVDLRPQAQTLRRLQHQLAERYHLRSYSVGREPQRRVRFLPNVRR